MTLPGTATILKRAWPPDLTHLLVLVGREEACVLADGPERLALPLERLLHRLLLLPRRLQLEPLLGLLLFSLLWFIIINGD